MVKKVKNFEKIFLSFFLFIFLIPIAVAPVPAADPLSEDTGSITIDPLTGNVILPGNVTYPLGTACTQNAQCNSGYCVDGYCCSSACSGSCNNCNVAGHLGTCTDVNTLCAKTDSSCYCSGGSCKACGSGATCTASYTCYSPGGGGGGGGGATTTTLPPVIQGATIPNISANGTGQASFTGLPITDISIKSKNNVTNVRITITKTDAQPATVAIGAPGETYAYLSIDKANITDSDITEVKIKFKVEKSWIANNNIDVSQIALYRYVNGQWIKLPTVKLSEDSTYIYFESTSPGLSVFAITGQHLVTTTTIPSVTTTRISPTTTTQPTGAGWTSTLITVLIITAVVIIVIAVALVRRSAKKHMAAAS